MNKKLIAQLEKAGFNGFFLALILMVVLGWLFPFYGTEHSPIPFSSITTYGVSLIFFFYGVKLSPAQLKEGLSNWKLHMLIQSTTFVFFPLVVLAFSFLLDGEYELLWLGTFYLAALPSTVSSSVVMVSIAGGNLPAAIFNASISSIIGVFITPLWMSSFIDETGGAADLNDVVIKLCLQVLVPVILGFSLHKWLGNWASRFKNELRYFDQFIILLIVYTAFAESFYGNMFRNHSLIEIILLGMLMLGFFLVMVAFMNLLSNLLKFSREDRITIIFCGSKKSLVQGAVMGKVLFPDPRALGVILLPLMLYHALQLLAGSAIAQRLAAQDKAIRERV
ncbi:bile acid:sodium symporter family protein [Chryseosolibacter indicus]|uniref:Bile acid:sodium symporter family protein n=1 Tax=Chryseosolibacter indicus TaxID=2782351 RepID=A0ABS5VR65_9BACT|nr:bile acid:sodium symporter family protein [Chryseosolibacter indicus]MBT1703944.1 bile acid:sodium symporter family protein [Chryseosolibacter indicus]